ncbi:MAG: ATP-binding protein [Pseudooceanicola sp.]
MTELTGPSGTLTRLSVALAPAILIVPAIAIGFLALSIISRNVTLALGLAGVGTTLLIAFVILRMVLGRYRLRSDAAVGAVAAFVADDAAPSFVTGAEGDFLHCNAAAEKYFGKPGIGGVSEALSSVLSNPGAVLRRLRRRAETSGAATEDVVTRRGQARLSVHRLPQGQFLWRYEEFSAAPKGAKNADVAVLTVGRSNSVLFMNEAARRLVGDRPKSLDAIFDTLPLRPGEMHDLRAHNGVVSVRVVELGESGGRRELMLLPAGEGASDADENASVMRGDFNGLPVPLLMVAPDGMIEGVNVSAGDLLGAECHPGARLTDLMEGLGRSITDWLSEAAVGRKPTYSEFLMLSKTEGETFVQVTLKPIKHKDRTSLIAVLSDATELKTLEAQFVQSQKMQAIGQLAGGVAHDFNNLLTAISGHCDLLLLRHDPGDLDYSDLMQINQNANRAASLVGQLLAFSRQQTLRPEVLDLRDTLSDLIHLLNRLVGEKVTLSLQHDPLLRDVRADKRQLEQVIMNLVVNSRDAMPDGGEIRIVTESLRLTEPMIRDRAEVAPGEYVSVKVIDTGSGISSDKLTKVFEPFFTTKRIGEGTGLGLSTAYGIVKQTGGFIFADSEQGVGTCFTLLFPVYEADLADLKAEEIQAPIEKPVSQRSEQFAEGVVLLVEDEAPVRAFASQALRLRGYTVLEADCAEAALETLSDDDLKVDIFVTDVVMPGMDGPSWVRKALEKRPGVHVVFVSGYAEANFGEDQGRIPNSVFLPKPFSLTQLTEMVQRQLH